MSKKTAFIVYATENFDLMEDFVHKFKIYNPDLDVKYDKDPYSNNIHDQLIGYAKTCDIAIILASQRLMHEDHYSNLKEIPVLIKRRKRNEITIVGIWLTNVDVTKWNDKGDISFCQIKKGELNGTRRNDRYATKHNSEVADYESISETDANTYHRKLSEWINTIIST